MEDKEFLTSLGKPIKLHGNYDKNTYSLGVKMPVESLPSSNNEKTISSLVVPLAPDKPKAFLAIKNNSDEDITFRLTTFNVSISDAKDILFPIEIKDESEIGGTFVDYDATGVTQYTLSPIFTPTPIPNYPEASTDNYGIIVKIEARLNLIKDDVIVRWGKGKVLCFSASCKNSNSFSFFFRHVEEF